MHGGPRLNDIIHPTIRAVLLHENGWLRLHSALPYCHNHEHYLSGIENFIEI